MVPAKVVAISAGVIVFAMAITGAGIVSAYLSEYGAERFVAAIVVLVLGGCMAVALRAFVLTYCKTRKHVAVAASVLGVILAGPLASTVYPGKITYCRFGLTVYGLVPVPLLDITVGPNGGLWFRDKSHYVSVHEVKGLLSTDVEVVLIGIGWNSEVKVDPAIYEMQSPEVRILPTPSAFAFFNQCVSEGRKVVLLAHSTC